MQTTQFFSGADYGQSQQAAESSTPGKILSTPVLVCIAVIASLLIAAVVSLAFLLTDSSVNAPWISALAGALCLFIVFTSLGLVMTLARGLGLGSRLHAFGLPPNSARAFLAVGVLVIFLFIGLTIYFDLAAPRLQISQGLSQSEIALLAAERVVRLEPVEGTTPQRFDVYLSQPQAEAASDIGKQMITAVATLLAAVSAFYFGARATSKETSGGVDEGQSPKNTNPFAEDRKEKVGK